MQTYKISVIPVPDSAVKAAGLARIDFADGYCSHTTLGRVTAIECARAMFDQPPPFAVALMSVRNRIVALFGLKTPAQLRTGRADARLVGIFPLVFESDHEVVIGGDDKHLNFRIWVAVQMEKEGSCITVSTLVGCHNTFGKIYLFFVMPFHRILSRDMFRRALQRLTETSANLSKNPGTTPTDNHQ